MKYSLWIMFILSSVQLNGQSWQEKISENVWQEYDHGKAEVPVILMLEKQLVIKDTKAIRGKKAKGRYVFKRLLNHASKQQNSIRNYLKKENIGYKAFLAVNAIAVKLNATHLQAFAKRDDVQSIIFDGLVRLTKTEESVDILRPRSVEPEWGIKMIKADSVWQQFGVMGEGVVVGGQDTGYKWDLPQLKDKYRGNDGSIVDHNYNWHDAIDDYNALHRDTINPCGLNLVVPCDDHNHGTHTMGTMVGSDTAYQIGVAPAAQWIGCRNMERAYGSPSTYTECFEWFLAPTNLNDEFPNPDLAPHVINNSWGCPVGEGCNTDNFELMNIIIQNLRAAGIVVVVSAGNSGNNCFTIQNPPAIFEGSFTVGSSNIQDTIANTSSRGIVTVDGSMRMKPNVVAPGVGVRSVLPDTSFAAWNGTSMAGPHVAGAVALLISAVPSLAGEVELIEDILEQTAKPLFSTQRCESDTLAYPNPTFGYGRIDVLAAIKEAQRLVGINKIDWEEEELILSPNPANDILTVHWSEATEEIVDLQVLNVQGQVILFKRQISIPYTLPIEALDSGMYILQLYNGGKIYSGRFVKGK